MRRSMVTFLTLMLILVLLTLSVGMPPVAASATHRTTASDSRAWNIVYSPNFGWSANNGLSSLAAISSDDIWAVGLVYSKIVLSSGHTLTEHWNGSQWSIIPSANVGAYSNHLYGVAAVSTHDVWAVGSHKIDQRGSGSQTLIEHWNGSAWSIIPSPNAGNTFNELYAVTALSANNVWAVGEYINIEPFQDWTLIEHWNGTQWSIIPGANPGVAGNSLGAIAGVSANNIWAVGSYYPTNGNQQTLIEHWNGTRWSTVRAPNVGRFENSLRGLASVTANNIWAVGSYIAPPGEINQTLIEHWNGTQWSVVSSPSPYTSLNSLAGIAAGAANNIWAVGYGYSSGTGAMTLTEHWNGSSWGVVSSPNLNPPADSLAAVAVLSTGDSWAVGSHLTPGLIFQTLSEHY